ncbi:MAG TPA: hypothetical protein VGM90_14930 [Kofleriaceae bacterium]|jgi:hypothetical protein
MSDTNTISIREDHRFTLVLERAYASALEQIFEEGNLSADELRVMLRTLLGDVLILSRDGLKEKHPALFAAMTEQRREPNLSALANYLGNRQ